MTNRDDTRQSEVREAFNLATDMVDQSDYANLDAAQDALLAVVDREMNLTEPEVHDVRDLIADWWHEVKHPTD